MEQLAHIKHFIFDIDGVLTSGAVLVTETGEHLRTVNIKDGYALQHAIKQGFKIAIISGGKSQGMLYRFNNLGIKDVFIGQSNKEKAFNSLLSKWQVQPSQIAYVGDDMPDYPLLQKVGLSCCPADAAQDIIDICTYIVPVNGGHGVARHLLENAMKLQDCWFNEDTNNW